MSKTRRFENIREAIRQQEKLSQAARAKIRVTSGRERYDAWSEKRGVGAHTRDLLLAYAFLRGMPYLRCEPATREGQSACGISIFWGLVEFGYREKPDGLTKCPGDIQDWLDTSVSTEARGAA